MGPDTALSRAFADSCARHADRTAIVVGDDRWSYRRLLAEVQAARQWFEDQFADQPFLLVPGKRPASVAAVVAGIMSTAVPLIADPVWTEAELTDVAHRCRARAIVAGGAAPEGVTWVSGTREVEVVADRADPVGLPSSPQTSFGRFSSGSTGRSRCLGFSSSAALAAADGSVPLLHFVAIYGETRSLTGVKDRDPRRMARQPLSTTEWLVFHGLVFVMPSPDKRIPKKFWKNWNTPTCLLSPWTMNAGGTATTISSQICCASSCCARTRK